MDNKLKDLIHIAAKHFILPANIVYGIVCAESDGIPTARRFEPAFLRRYISKDIKKADPEEANGRATSWGLMQVMGENLRAMGYELPFEGLLHDRENALHYGCKFLRSACWRYYYKYGIEGVIAAYNAGSPRKKANGTFVNQAYVDKVIRRSKEF